VVDNRQAREALQGVAKTALGAARMRAEESHRDDRLFEDPYAQGFLDAAPETPPAVTRDGGGDLADLGASLGRHVVIRTRFPTGVAPCSRRDTTSGSPPPGWSRGCS